jgi:hypothetical protein
MDGKSNRNNRRPQINSYKNNCRYCKPALQGVWERLPRTASSDTEIGDGMERFGIYTYRSGLNGTHQFTCDRKAGKNKHPLVQYDGGLFCGPDC